MLKKLHHSKKNGSYKLVLEVYVKEGRDLVQDPLGATCNPVAYAQIPNTSPGRTGRQKHTSYPHWNSKIKLKLCEDAPAPGPFVKVVVFDVQRRQPPEYLGEARISYRDIRFGADYQWLRLYSTQSEKRFVTGSVYVRFELKKRRKKLGKSSALQEVSSAPLLSLWEAYLEHLDPFADAADDTTVTDEQGFYRFEDNGLDKFLLESDLDDDDDEIPARDTVDGAPVLVDFKTESGSSDTDVSAASLTDENREAEAHVVTSAAADTVDSNLLQPPATPMKLTMRDSFGASQTDLDTTDVTAYSSMAGSSADLASLPKGKRKFKIAAKKKSSDYRFSNCRDVLGVIFLEIISAEGLPPFKSATRTGFDMDPFVVVSFGRKIYRSSWRKHTLSPLFNERLAFEVLPAEKNFEIQFNVLDKDHFSFHDKVGTAKIPVSQLMDDDALEQKLHEQNPMMTLLDASSDHVTKRKKKLIGRNPERNINKAQSDSTKLRTFNLNLTMDNANSKLYKNGAEYAPTLKIRAHFEPYTALRRQFWTNLLTRYDDENSGHLDVLQLEHFLRSVGSSLGDSTIQNFFTAYNKNPWAGETLTVDEVVESLEKMATDDERQDSGHFFDVPLCPICHKRRLSHRSESDIITHVAICASKDWSTVNKLLTPSFASEQMATKRWYSKVLIKLTYGKYGIGRNSANILVQDRNTGLIMEEKMSVYVRLGIKLFYRSFFDRAIDKKKMKKLLRNVTVKQGAKFDTRMSASQIASFVQFHQLDLSECLVQDVSSFKTFNQFFYRRLQRGARPLETDDPMILCSPCDSRITVYDTITAAKEIWIKGRDFTIQKLLYKNDQGLLLPQDQVARYEQGSIGIFRLAPQDYHRFHSPCDGVIGKPLFIDGEYYTVNPMAIRSELDVFGDNVRCIIPIETDHFGTVIMVAVGAMMVGSILLSVEEGDYVTRGDEVGYFKFGGSTILLLFEQDRFKFDSDLVANSNERIETLVRVGMSIGHDPSVDELKRVYRDFTKQPEEDKLKIIRSITGGAGIKGPGIDLIDDSLIAKINQHQPSDELSLKELSWEAYNMDIDEEDEQLLQGLDLDDVPDSDTDEPL